MGRWDANDANRLDGIRSDLDNIKRAQGAVTKQFGELREEIERLGVHDIGQRLHRLEVEAGLRSPNGQLRSELPSPM